MLPPLVAKHSLALARHSHGGRLGSNGCQRHCCSVYEGAAESSVEAVTNLLRRPVTRTNWMSQQNMDNMLRCHD
jgi:hypothetical protein